MARPPGLGPNDGRTRMDGPLRPLGQALLAFLTVALCFAVAF